MVCARLHIICGNCGCNDMFEYRIDPEGQDFGDRFEPSVRLHCRNCATIHALEDNAKAIAQTAPQARNVVAYRTIDRHGNVITDWIDGDPAGGDPIVPGGSFQLAYGAPQPEQSGIADLPYQTLFNAIAAATDAGDSPVSISVKAFRAALSTQGGEA